MLDTLPARIAELRARKASLQSLLDDSGLYVRDPAKFGEILAAFAAAEAALAEQRRIGSILRSSGRRLGANVATGQSPNQSAVSRICSLNDSGHAQNLDSSP